uniref:AP complex mu/sigma subunit domain-containing protein n=1 Tax=Peromyscus maniculatus bairdii TaxID=230844 RepID=A0A8C8W4Q8_PERMB
MIKDSLIFNTQRKLRLPKFCQHCGGVMQQQIIKETSRGLLIGGSDNKLVYRHYATLYFVFCVDSSESELGILDLMQVFVGLLDKCFENVCELDSIFCVDKVHILLAELLMGLESNANELLTQIDAENKVKQSEAGLADTTALDVSAVKNMNLRINVVCICLDVDISH